MQQNLSNQTFEEDPMLNGGYERQYGAYKPHFKGRHRDYYPFEPKDYLGVALYTLLTWLVCIPIWYGCYVAGRKNSKQYATVCVIVFVGFYICMVTGMYFMGRLRPLYEKEIIAKKLKELEEEERQQKKQPI